MFLLADAFCPFADIPDLPKVAMPPVLWDTVNTSQYPENLSVLFWLPLLAH